MAQTRPSNTAGVDLPMKSAFQIRFSPLVDQEEINPVSSETPVCHGPRHPAHSAALAVAGAVIMPSRRIADADNQEPAVFRMPRPMKGNFLIAGRTTTSRREDVSPA